MINYIFSLPVVELQEAFFATHLQEKKYKLEKKFTNPFLSTIGIFWNGFQ